MLVCSLGEVIIMFLIEEMRDDEQKEYTQYYFQQTLCQIICTTLTPLRVVQLIYCRRNQFVKRGNFYMSYMIVLAQNEEL